MSLQHLITFDRMQLLRSYYRYDLHCSLQGEDAINFFQLSNSNLGLMALPQTLGSVSYSLPLHNVTNFNGSQVVSSSLPLVNNQGMVTVSVR